MGKVGLSGRSRKIASWSAALSMLLPIGMVLRGLTDGSMMFSPIAILGVISLMVSAGYLLAGARDRGEEVQGIVINKGEE